jgi:D-alanyl-D-alanine carboxypeptidase
MSKLVLFSIGCLVLLLHCAGREQSVKIASANTAPMMTATDTLPPYDSTEQIIDMALNTPDTEELLLKSTAPNPTKTDNKTVAYLMGKFDYTRHEDFVSVSKPYTDREGMFLRKETYAAFVKMHQAARREGITLTIISSTRSFFRQKEIWEGKWERFAAETPDPEARARRILEYSSMPGSSRHHWGTDIDLNDLENDSFEPGGPHERVYQWLVKNAHRFGFGQPYTPKGPDRPEGYNEEKWHWSYLPLSKPLLQQYHDMITDDHITGFTGADIAAKIGIVQNYILGISPTCK